MNQSNEGQTARMLVDIVLQDIAMQISDKQFAAFCLLWESLQQGSVERLTYFSCRIFFFFFSIKSFTYTFILFLEQN